MNTVFEVPDLRTIRLPDMCPVCGLEHSLVDVAFPMFGFSALRNPWWGPSWIPGTMCRRHKVRLRPLYRIVILLWFLAIPLTVAALILMTRPTGPSSFLIPVSAMAVLLLDIGSSFWWLMEFFNVTKSISIAPALTGGYRIKVAHSEYAVQFERLNRQAVRGDSTILDQSPSKN